MSSNFFEKLIKYRGDQYAEAEDKARDILHRALDGDIPTYEELSYLATLQGFGNNLAIFRTARKICELHFGRKIFLYGFVYFSTYCRNSCTFCFFRKANNDIPRYRKSLHEVVEIVAELENSGVHLVDLTMGEDSLIHEKKGSKLLLDICEIIKKEFKVSLMVSPGVLNREALSKLGNLGADWYALYQETHNRVLFSKLRKGQDYDERMEAKVNAAREGLLVEEGILLGVGETPHDIVDSSFEMKRLGAHQVRAMGFAPRAEIPLGCFAPPIIYEMKAIALLRLTHQDRIIPASCDIDGARNLEARFMAGANAVTSLIPPGFGLMGVAQTCLNIDNGLRTVDGIKPHLKSMGLEPADRKTYRRWIDSKKESLRR